MCLEDDTATFSVAVGGNGPFTYQWMCDATNIPGATNCSYTISSVQWSDAGSYSVVVSNSVTSVSSRTAQLTVEGGTGDPLLMVVQGPRQDYSFKHGVTYYIGSSVELYGTTTLRGGSVIKFDGSTNSSLVVKGALVCDTEPYYPAILTSVDDDSQGEWLSWISSGHPRTATNAVPYLDLDAAASNVIRNLRICYADDQSNLFASLAGPVDANGFCDDPDTLQPGITISIVDDQGHQLPSAYYTILLTVFPAADPPPVTLQRRVQVEKPWASYPGEWVVAYQPLFDPNSASGMTQSRSLAASTDYIANTAPFNNNSILSSPLTAGGNVPMILGNLENQNWTPGYNGAVQWSSLATILSEKTPGQNARNLYMFCHFCNGQYLGGTANPSWGISLERLNNSILLNGPNLLDPVLSHTNRHPYRFVFIDGCESANGNLASAFGIPLLQTNYLAWTNLAIPARAFVGWKNVKIGRSFNALPNQDHLIYIRSFFDLWSSFNRLVSRICG